MCAPYTRKVLHFKFDRANDWRGNGSSWPDGGLHAQGKAGRERGQSFFQKAIKHQGQPPETITLGGYAASHRAVREMKADGPLAEDTKARSSKYLNNLIGQDHRNIKSRTNVMLGFKRFRSAATTIAGIELTHGIRKGSLISLFPHSKMPLRLPSGMLPCLIDKVPLYR
jgi:hypothetical protein